MHVAAPGLQVRLAREGEADKVYPLVAALVAEEGGAPPHPVAFTGAFNRSFAAAFRYALAERSGRAVGCVSLHDRFSTWRAAPALAVEDLYVVPDERGAGVGRALLAFAEREARARGAARLELLVREGNARARALYEREGWKDSGYVWYTKDVGGAEDAELKDLFG